MNRTALLFIIFLLAVFPTTVFAGNGIGIESYDTRGAFPIVSEKGRTATFVISPEDAEVVTTAAEAVAGDIALITGHTPAITSSISKVKYPIIAGTVGQSSLIDSLASVGKIDVSEIRGKWETYGLAVVDRPFKGVERALVAYGSNPRGTAYALFELSRLMGVSPWVWWADVLPERRDALYTTPGVITVGEPSVRWRGIFINDEDWGLNPWASKGLDAKYGNIGPNTYAKVMELLLRLRANLLWPAMHLCSQAFWDNKDNLPVAKKYDIALGSSHCEQMLRDNEWEWRRYEDGTGTNENWNYIDNRERVQRYWEERVEESKGYSAMYTLGMRGVHDSGIRGYKSSKERVRGLSEIIDFQRSLLRKHIGDPETVPQIYIPYKEALDVYNAGLKVPDDVILTWVDDNHGYIRQLPTPDEQRRPGGHGIYYHLSYWGKPADYLWLSSASPSLISYELTKGYENGIRDLWVINVGDIKPAETELEFCMDLAWDIDAWRPDRAYGYTQGWMVRTFGEELAAPLADIKLEYYSLAAAGKPEHVFSVDYPSSEMDERIERYRAISERVDSLTPLVPERLRDAYFQLIEYPVKGVYYMNLMTFRARQSLDLARHGYKDQALAYAAQATDAHDAIAQLTEKYNNGIASGKWNGMMDCKPRRQKQFDLPTLATIDSIAPTVTEISETHYIKIPAADYVRSQGSIIEIPGLGVSKSSITVSPIDYTDYGKEGRIGDAPYVEYSVPVREGTNSIQLRFLPTFPIHSRDNLDVAVSIVGGDKAGILAVDGKESTATDAPQIHSLKTVATKGKWNQNVLRGYNDITLTYMSPSDTTITLRISLLTPAVTLSEMRIIATNNISYIPLSVYSHYIEIL